MFLIIAEIARRGLWLDSVVEIYHDCGVKIRDALDMSKRRITVLK